MEKGFFNGPKGLYTGKNKYLLLASLGGIGYFRKGSGTIASLITVIIAYFIALVNPAIVVILAILITLLGFYVCSSVHLTAKDQDPSYIVIDEVAGQLIAVVLANTNIILFIVAFIAFRILDITKLWIIGMAERKFKGGVAIMMDDIIAGFVSLIIVLIVSLFI